MIEVGRRGRTQKGNFDRVILICGFYLSVKFRKTKSMYIGREFLINP